MVNLACLCILHGFSPVDIDFRSVSIGERRKLPVNNLVDSCGDTEALALVMIARDGSFNFPVTDCHILERLTEHFTELDQQGASHIDRLLINLLQ